MRSLRVLVLALMFAGCDQGPSDVTSRKPRSQTNAGDPSSVRVTIRDGDLILPREDVPPGRTIIVVANDGPRRHLLRLERGGETVMTLSVPETRGPGGIIRADLRPGTYDLYCAIPEHRDRERTTVRVR